MVERLPIAGPDGLDPPLSARRAMGLWLLIAAAAWLIIALAVAVALDL